MPKTGEKPGKGKYKCNKCGYILELASDDETLPECPRCKATDFTKIE